MKITAYKILNTQSKSALEVLVDTYIKSGWQPLGGVATSADEVWEFSQAMVQYESKYPVKPGFTEDRGAG